VGFGVEEEDEVVEGKDGFDSPEVGKEMVCSMEKVYAREERVLRDAGKMGQQSAQPPGLVGERCGDLGKALQRGFNPGGGRVVIEDHILILPISSS
jgi:hypothetical protein